MRKLVIAFTIIAGALVARPAQVRAHGAYNMLMGSTASGGGALKLDYDFSSVARVGFDSTVGGISVYTGIEPAFELLKVDDIATPSYVLATGTDVNVVVTAIDDGNLSIHIMNVDNSTTYTLAHVGDTALLGVVGPGNTLDPSAPDPHVHPTLLLQLALPEGQFGEASVSFKLTTTSMAYTESPIYTLKVSNGPLAPIDYDTTAYGAKSVTCQKTVGSQVSGFSAKKFNLLRPCLDKLQVYKAMSELTTPPPGLAAALTAAEKACANASATTPDATTLLGKLAKAQAAAFTAIQKKCGTPNPPTVPNSASGDFSDDDINQQLGFAGCRVEELVAGAYGGARAELALITARASQGGKTLDSYFPCLHTTASE